MIIETRIRKLRKGESTSGSTSKKQDLPDTNDRGSSEDLTVRKDYDDASSEAKDGQKEQKREAENASEREAVASKFAKRNADESVMSAKERYLARKAAKGNVKAHVTVEED